MQETPLIIFTTSLANATLWLTAASYIYYKNHKRINPLAESFLILCLTLTVSLPLATIEVYYPKGIVFATANLIYTILIAAGILVLINGLIKIYYSNINVKHVIITAAAIVVLLKFYNYLDWVILDLPVADQVSLTVDILVLSIIIAVIPVSLKAHRKVRSNILKAKLELLIAAIIFMLTAVVIIVTPGNPLYNYRFIIGISLLIPFTILGVASVTYRHKETLQLTIVTQKNTEENKFEQKVAALLLKHTSKEGSCEYYDPNLKSKCKLDPSSYRLEDCKGLKYRNGFICPKILRQEQEQDSFFKK